MWHGVLRQVLEFPEDDIEVNLVPRKIRTEDHVVPEEPYSQVWTSTVEIIRFASVLFQLDPTVQNCVDCYTSDWVVVNRKYQQYSSSVCIRCPQTHLKEEEQCFEWYKILGTGVRRSWRWCRTRRGNNLRLTTHQNQPPIMIRYPPLRFKTNTLWTRCAEQCYTREKLEEESFESQLNHKSTRFKVDSALNSFVYIGGWEWTTRIEVKGWIDE